MFSVFVIGMACLVFALSDGWAESSVFFFYFVHSHIDSQLLQRRMQPCRFFPCFPTWQTTGGNSTVLLRAFGSTPCSYSPITLIALPPLTRPSQLRARELWPDVSPCPQFPGSLLSRAPLARLPRTPIGTPTPFKAPFSAVLPEVSARRACL